jgi:two-component system OmpR family response regulator
VLKTPVMPLGRILVVDDNADNVEIIATRLRFRGYEIVEATNGEAALKSVRSDRPDLILLDVMLPDIDGYEIARRIKELMTCLLFRSSW